jgi:hypothetical protein
MIIQAGHSGVELDTGTNAPGAILQKYIDGEWRDFPVDGPVLYLMDLAQLPAGKYRLRDSKTD